jgi:hypothetical protein
MTQIGEARKWFEDHVYLETDECIVWPFGVVTNGYGGIKIRKSQRVHVLAYKRHYGEIPEGMFVCHGSCHNKLCMNYRHLYLGTNSSNQLDRRRDGTVPDQYGEKNHSVKLSDLDVSKIIEFYDSKKYIQSELADLFGVSQFGISYVLRNRRPINTGRDLFS